MTVAELIAKFQHYLQKYPKRSGEKPLALQADIDDTYHTVSLKTQSVSVPAFALFERTGFGEALSVSSVKAALEGFQDQTISVVIDSGSTRYNVVDVAADKKQTLVLLTQKI